MRYTFLLLNVLILSTSFLLQLASSAQFTGGPPMAPRRFRRQALKQDNEDDDSHPLASPESPLQAALREQRRTATSAAGVDQDSAANGKSSRVVGQTTQQLPQLASLLGRQVDKRSWAPRASRKLQARGEQEVAKVNLLLEEVASLDIEAANSNSAHSRRVQEQPATQSQNNGRIRGRVSTYLMGSSGARGNSQGSHTVVNGGQGAESMPSFRLSAADYAKQRANSNHLPCFFNAIACF